MKLYDSKTAPNPRRVRIFLAEKGITVPTEPVDIAGKQNRGAEYAKKNPMTGVPILELDDGTVIAETGMVDNPAVLYRFGAASTESTR